MARHSRFRHLLDTQAAAVRPLSLKSGPRRRQTGETSEACRCRRANRTDQDVRCIQSASREISVNVQRGDRLRVVFRQYPEGEGSVPYRSLCQYPLRAAKG